MNFISRLSSKSGLGLLIFGFLWTFYFGFAYMIIGWLTSSIYNFKIYEYKNEIFFKEIIPIFMYIIKIFGFLLFFKILRELLKYAHMLAIDINTFFNFEIENPAININNYVKISIKIFKELSTFWILSVISSIINDTIVIFVPIIIKYIFIN